MTPALNLVTSVPTVGYFVWEGEICLAECQYECMLKVNGHATGITDAQRETIEKLQRHRVKTVLASGKLPIVGVTVYAHGHFDLQYFDGSKACFTERFQELTPEEAEQT